MQHTLLHSRCAANIKTLQCCRVPTCQQLGLCSTSGGATPQGHMPVSDRFCARRHARHAGMAVACHAGQPHAGSTRGPTMTASLQAASAPSAPSLYDIVQGNARHTTVVAAVLAQIVQPGDVVVDATMGNGHDTLLLASMVGPTGVVHAFDVQQQAVDATAARLASELPQAHTPQVHLHRACHSTIQQVVGSNLARAVVFNLGYLPNSDKAVITNSNTTCEAIEAALEVVRPGGLITVLCYIGHPGGKEEYEAVCATVNKLPTHYWSVSETRVMNRPTAPILILVWRRDEAFIKKALPQGWAY